MIRESLRRSLAPTPEVKRRLSGFLEDAVRRYEAGESLTTGLPDDPVVPSWMPGEEPAGSEPPVLPRRRKKVSAYVVPLASAAMLLLIVALFWEAGPDAFVADAIGAAQSIDPDNLEWEISEARTEHCYCDVLRGIRATVSRECSIPDMVDAGYVFQGATRPATTIAGQEAVTLVYRHESNGSLIYMHLLWDQSVGISRAQPRTGHQPEDTYWVESIGGHTCVCWIEDGRTFALVLPTCSDADGERELCDLADRLRHPLHTYTIPKGD